VASLYVQHSTLLFRTYAKITEDSNLFIVRMLSVLFTLYSLFWKNERRLIKSPCCLSVCLSLCLCPSLYVMRLMRLCCCVCPPPPPQICSFFMLSVWYERKVSNSFSPELLLCSDALSTYNDVRNFCVKLWFTRFSCEHNVQTSCFCHTFNSLQFSHGALKTETRMLGYSIFISHSLRNVLILNSF
jgi:hypothetical protein